MQPLPIRIRIPPVVSSPIETPRPESTSLDVERPVRGVDPVAEVVFPLEAVVLRDEGGPAGIGEVGADAAADEAEEPEEDAVEFYAGVVVGEPGFFVFGGEPGGFEFGGRGFGEGGGGEGGRRLGCVSVTEVESCR